MAGIIKASGPSAGRVVSGALFNFDDVSAKANQYLEQVKRDAALIVQRAREDADRVRRDAEEKGRQTGLQSADQVVQQRVQQTVQHEVTTMLPILQSAVDAVQQAKQEWFAHWEANVIHLAVAIAERIIRCEVARKPEITLQLIRESLELTASSKKQRLHLNPQDLQRFGEQAQQLAKQINKVGQTEIVSDPAVTAGGCKLTTEYGEVDHQLESQLARITEELA